MLTLICRAGLIAVTLASLSNVTLAATANPPTLYSSLARSAPELNPTVLKSALSAVQCAVNNGEERSDRLAVIDYSQPSTARRLWIFNLRKKTLVLRDLVAHGAKSGEKLRHAIFQSRRQPPIQPGFVPHPGELPGHPRLLRMDGLEPGFNDQARDRALVIHAADYVNPAWSRREGRIGRSQGCPAVRPQVARQVVDKLKDGQFMFSWYPDQRWLKSSTYLNCKPQQVASSRTIRGG